MKMNIIPRGSLKKGFRDLHELLDTYTLQEMLALHKARSEFTHNEAQLRSNLVNFQQADEEYYPLCLRGKYWVFIKEGFEELVKGEEPS